MRSSRWSRRARRRPGAATTEKRSYAASSWQGLLHELFFFDVCQCELLRNRVGHTTIQHDDLDPALAWRHDERHRRLPGRRDARVSPDARRGPKWHFLAI